MSRKGIMNAMIVKKGEEEEQEDEGEYDKRYM